MDRTLVLVSRQPAYYGTNGLAGFDSKKLANSIFDFFGPGTEYERVRLQTESPKKGPWTNHCIKIMVAKRENGDSPAVDEKGQDPDGFCKTVALASLLNNTAEAYSLKDKVEACVKTVQVSTYSKRDGSMLSSAVLQSNPVAVEYAVGGFNILENVIRSGEVDLDNICANENVKDSVKTARDNNDPHKEAAKSWGLACGKYPQHPPCIQKFIFPIIGYPTSFIVGVHGIKCAENYVDAVRNEARAGGDNCSRVILVGSVLGAKYVYDVW